MGSKHGQRLLSSYGLEKLYLDQPRDHVMEVMAPTIAWLSEDPSTRTRVSFELLNAATRSQPKRLSMTITWDPDVLVRYDADVLARADRIRKGRSALTEK